MTASVSMASPFVAPRTPLASRTSIGLENVRSMRKESGHPLGKQIGTEAVLAAKFGGRGRARENIRDDGGLELRE